MHLFTLILAFVGGIAIAVVLIFAVLTAAYNYAIGKGLNL